MLRSTGFVLLCLSSLIWAGPQEAETDERQLQALVDEAVRLNISQPPQVTLDYLDSIEGELAGATLRQMAQLKLVEARSRALMTDYDPALEILEDLLARDLDPEQRLRTLALAANLAIHIDRFEDGFQYLNQGLVLQESVDDPALKSDIFGLATYWHSQMGDREKGLEYGFRTLDLAQASGDTREICVALEKLGQAKEMLGMHEEALARYQAGLNACQEARDPVFTAALHSLMGRLLFRMERHEEAESWLRQALELNADAGFEDGLMDTMTHYAGLLLAMERHEEARTMLHELLDRIRLGGRPYNLADTHLMLSRISHHSGDYRSAWEHLDEYVRAREKVLDIERARLIAFQEVQFELRNREQEIQLLREQARVSALQETTRRQQRLLQQVAFAMAAFILVLLLVLLMRTLRERRHFRHLSVHDGLTRMLNHTHFFETAKAQTREASERRRGLTLLLADIDHFKQFNDRHGHQAGDEVLRKAARCFREALSQHGIVGRIGGEEFAACLPALDPAKVAELVHQVREALMTCTLPGVEDTITMSFGIARLRASDEFESLRARADAALYQAKHEGRDRIVLADSEPDAEA